MENQDVAAPGAPYRVEDQVGFKLRLANQKHLDVFARLIPEATPTQFAVLAKLLDEGTMSQNHLGRLVGMDAATVKGVVDRLARKGLVTRTPSRTDMRRLDIALSAEGRDFARDALPRAREISARTTAKLSARETQRLLALLDKL